MLTPSAEVVRAPCRRFVFSTAPAAAVAGAGASFAAWIESGGAIGAES